MKSLGGLAVGGLAAAAPEFTTGALLLVGSVSLAAAGGFVGERLGVGVSDALFQGEDYARAWRPVFSAPLALAGAVTGLVAGSVVFGALHELNIGPVGAALIGAGAVGSLAYYGSSGTNPITPLVQRIEEKFPSPDWAY